MNVGIILAAGKGKRFKAKKINKTSIDFGGKPLLEYSLDLFDGVCDKVIVVVGAYSESLQKIIAKYPKAIPAIQKKRLGTGHAVKVALKKIGTEGWVFDKVFVGYGDHMMFYSKGDLQSLLSELRKKKAEVSMVTCEHDPETLAWGRIIRNSGGGVDAIVEEKVATPEQRKIRELNAGFYCLNFDFLREGVPKIKKTPGGECYFTDIVSVARNLGKKVIAVKLPFEHVGIGVNTPEDLEKSLELLKKRKVR